VVALVADVATCVLLWQVLVRRGRDPRWVAVFAWSPTAVLEGVPERARRRAGDAVRRGRVAWAGRRPALSGAALGAAAMVKLYPALLLPLLLGGAGAGAHARSSPSARPATCRTCWPSASTSRLPAGLPAGGAVRRRGPVPAAAAAGAARAGGDGGGRGGRAGGGGRVLVLARRAGRAQGDGAGRGDLAPAGCLLLGAALLLSSPVQPWYGLPLVALAALAARPVWAVVPALTYPVFFAVIATGPSPAVWRTGSACYLGALAVLLLAALRRRGAVPDRPKGPSAVAGGPFGVRGRGDEAPGSTTRRC
jgi:hypothetical protein